MRIADRWTAFRDGAGGGRDVITIAYPLILSQMSFTVQTFVDRLFLTWYSPEAVAGAVTGVFVTLALMGTFVGTGEYLTTFIAQYVGAGRDVRVGATLWQGIYFSLGAGLLLAAVSPVVRPVFELAGHPPLVQSYEVTYARLLLLGAGPVVLMATLSTFFAGRGETRAILLVNVFTTAVNVVLDALWIFGRGGFPRAGVAGAALATISSQVAGSLVFALLIFRPAHRRRYGLLSHWRPDRALFARILRFGMPAGLQFSLELLSFAVFMMIVGRIGTPALAASGIAFNLNMIVFMPMLGLGTGVSSLVGRYLGAEAPALAERSVRSAFAMSLAYMTACGALYVLAPRLLLAPYAAGSDPAAFAEVGRLSIVLLRFVALYSIFDMMNLVFSGALKGAGDTVYPLLATIVLSWSLMIVPAYLGCILGGGGVNMAWTAATAYIAALGLLMRRRFRRGGWRRLRVIEPRLAELEAAG